MRKFVSSLLLFFFLVTGVEAQEFSFGIKGGVNFSNIHSNNTPLEDLTKSRTNFHLGGFTEWRFSKLFALQLEALYSGQGAKIRNTYIEITPPRPITESWETQAQVPAQPQSSYTNVSGKYDYITLPLYAKLYVYEGLNVFAGPQLSVLLSAKDSNESEEVNAYDQIDPVDFGLSGGLGYQCNMGLFFSASYYRGLNNISSVNTTNIGGYNINLHQGVFHISTGYRF